MLQFSIEVICNYVVAAAYLCMTILCAVQGIARKNPPLLIMGAFSVVLMLGFGITAISYMLVLEDVPIAMNFKLAGSLITNASFLIWFIWMDYVQYERVRLVTFLPIYTVIVLYYSAMLAPNALRLVTFVENGEVIATSMGKTGIAAVWDAICTMIGFLGMLWYFVVQLRNAPLNLKPVARFMAGFILGSMVILFSLNFIVRPLPDNGIALVLWSLIAIIYALDVCLFIVIIVRVPDLLYILGFQVSRFMVIHGESGISLFDYKFREHAVDPALFSGLLQGLQHVSLEVLQHGDLQEIRLKQGVLTLYKRPLFTVGLLSTRSSKFLTKCLEQFAQAFEIEFRAQVETFGGDVTAFSKAETLIDKYFEYMPRYVQ